MVKPKPKVKPVRRSLRLKMKAQKDAAVPKAPVVRAAKQKMSVHNQVKAGENSTNMQTRQTAAGASVDRDRDDEVLERARAEVRPPAKVKKAVADVKTRIKGIPAQKKVNSRLSSNDSLMSGTSLIVPKPRAARTGRVKYRGQKLPKPRCAGSSSSSNDSQPNVRNTRSGNKPLAGPSAGPGSQKLCMVCGKQDDSLNTSERDPRIGSALSQAIITIRRQTCIKCGRLCPRQN